MSKLCIPLDVEDVCRKEDKKKTPGKYEQKTNPQTTSILHPLFVSVDWVVGWAWPPIPALLKGLVVVAGYLRVISAKKTRARLSVSSDEIFSAAPARRMPEADRETNQPARQKPNTVRIRKERERETSRRRSDDRDHSLSPYPREPEVDQLLFKAHNTRMS